MPAHTHGTLARHPLTRPELPHLSHPLLRLLHLLHLHPRRPALSNPRHTWLRRRRT